MIIIIIILFTGLNSNTLEDITLGFVSLQERDNLCRHISYLAASFLHANYTGGVCSSWPTSPMINEIWNEN